MLRQIPNVIGWAIRTLSAISVPWLSVVYEMASLFRLFKVLEEYFNANGLLHSCEAKKDIHSLLNFKKKL